MPFKEVDYVTDWEAAKVELTIRAKQFETLPRKVVPFHGLVKKYLYRQWEMTAAELDRLKWLMENTDVRELATKKGIA
jgi:hypothetical protein